MQRSGCAEYTAKRGFPASHLLLVFRPIQMIQRDLTVTPGLVPGIHGTGKAVLQFVDGRDEPGHDDLVNRLSESEH